jgi:hypothetical protein
MLAHALLLISSQAMPTMHDQPTKVLDDGRVTKTSGFQMTAPAPCSALGPWAAPIANVSCDGERLSLSSASTPDAAACNAACVQEQAVAWTWVTNTTACWCKAPPLSPLQNSSGVVSGLACF